jgi:hypothetical protein
MGEPTQLHDILPYNNSSKCTYKECYMELCTPGHAEIDSKKEIIYIYLEDGIRVFFLALNARLMFCCLSPKQVSSKFGKLSPATRCVTAPPHLILPTAFTTKCLRCRIYFRSHLGLRLLWEPTIPSRALPINRSGGRSSTRS